MTTLLQKSLLAAALSLSTCSILPMLGTGAARAQSTDPICPSSPAAAGLANKEAFGMDPTYNGFCRGTPSVYGISVYKMGFCTKNPIAGGAGVKADYSTCQITYKSSSTSGSAASFAAGSSLALPASGTSFPAIGSYSYAIIELAPSFDVADSFGPFGDGLTYYSTTSSSPTGNPASTTSGAAATFTHQMNTFNDGSACDASDTVTIAGASLTGALLNSSNELIADDSSVTKCPGVSKLLGVAKLATPVSISSKTKGLTATFTVTNNGSSVYCDGIGPSGCSNILFSSGPFNVSFTVVE